MDLTEIIQTVSKVFVWTWKIFNVIVQEVEWPWSKGSKFVLKISFLIICPKYSQNFLFLPRTKFISFESVFFCCIMHELLRYSKAMGPGYCTADKCVCPDTLCSLLVPRTLHTSRWNLSGFYRSITSISAFILVHAGTILKKV